MPFRAKFKKALGGGGGSSGTASPGDSSSEKPDKSFLSKTGSRRPLKTADGQDWPENVYKPWEPMPRPKYRGPWNQAHQDKLSAFSFGSSSRRRRSSATSTARTGSEYSPMGSKLPSRGQSRRNSAISWSSFKGGRKRPGMGSRQGSGRDGGRVLEDGEEDDDVGNVGLSRQHTVERRPPRHPPLGRNGTNGTDGAASTAGDLDGMEGLATQKTVTNGHLDLFTNGFTDDLSNQQTVTNTNGANGALFTEEELAQALTASTLKPKRRERE